MTLVHAQGTPPDRLCPIPSGHRVTRARLRHLVNSERLVVTRQDSCLGVAAYQASESQVRVVHDLLVDRRLSPKDAGSVVEMLLAGLEFAARSECVTCLVVLIEGDVSPEPFIRCGYTALLADAAGAWLQKKLDWSVRLMPCSRRVH